MIQFVMNIIPEVLLQILLESLNVLRSILEVLPRIMYFVMGFRNASLHFLPKAWREVIGCVDDLFLQLVAQCSQPFSHPDE